MKLRSITAAVGALCATTCAVLIPIQPAAANSTVKIVDHNVRKDSRAIQAAVDKATQIGADGITLQEVCRSQADALEATWAGRWTVNWSVGKKDACGTGNDVGTVAVWTGGPGGIDQDLVLPQDGTTPGDNHPTRNPHLTCVKYGSSPRRHVCSAHLVAFDVENVRAAQTKAIKDITGAWIAKSHAVFVGGDFNTGPKSAEMNHMYAEDGNGRFVEANQIADGTRGGNLATAGSRKIDYVFFSKNRTVESAAGGIQLFSTVSDHKMLVARATVNY